MSQLQNNCRVIAAVVFSVLLGGEPFSSQVASAPVDVRIPFAPAPVVSDGQTRLGYELHVTNFYRSTGTLRLERVEVFAADRAPVLRREGSDLAGLVVHPRALPPPADPLVIPGGMHVVVYLWVTLPAGERVPTSLRHRLVFRTDKATEEVVDGAKVEVRRWEPPVLGPPFRVGIWLVANGPGNHRSHHWGGMLAINGRVAIPQRFAMDLMGLDLDLRAVRGDFRTSASHLQSPLQDLRGSSLPLG